MINYFVLPGIIKQRRSAEITFDEILSVVADVMNVKSSQIKIPKRTRELTIARHIFYRIARVNTKESLVSIAKYFNQDHTTVIHGLNTLSNLMENEEWLVHAVDLCQSRVNRIKGDTLSYLLSDIKKNNQMHL